MPPNLTLSKSNNYPTAHVEAMENFALGISYGLATSALVYVVRSVVVSLYKALREAV